MNDLTGAGLLGLKNSSVNNLIPVQIGQLYLFYDFVDGSSFI